MLWFAADMWGLTCGSWYSDIEFVNDTESVDKSADNWLSTIGGESISISRDPSWSDASPSGESTAANCSDISVESNDQYVHVADDLHNRYQIAKWQKLHEEF